MTLAKHDAPLLQNDDLYPSRIFPAPSMQQRIDPVVYGRGEPPLERRQLIEYAQKGFTVIKSLFGTDEVRSFLDELDKIKRDKHLRDHSESVAKIRHRPVSPIYGVHRFGDLFAELVTDQRIVRIAEYILGGEVYVHQSRAIMEPGLYGETDYWHSDFETWHTEDGMPRMRAMSAAIMLSEPAEGSGPLMFIPGSHYSFIACVTDTANDSDKAGIPDDASVRHLVNEGGIEIPAGAPGSVILFDCNTLYGSNSNITPHPRRRLCIAYNSIENPMKDPYCGSDYRSEVRATRDNIYPIKPRNLRLVK